MTYTCPLSSFFRSTQMFGAALCLGLVSVAFQGSPGSTATISQPPSIAAGQTPTNADLAPYCTSALKGQFVFAPGDSRIWVQDAASIYFSLSTVGDDISRTQKHSVARGPASGGAWNVVLEDGNLIVFAASGPPKKTLPRVSLERNTQSESSGEPEGETCALGIVQACLVQRVHADGLPWDIWLVGPDGTRISQLTKLGFDSPWPVFPKDGRYIAFISTNELFAYDRETKQVSLLDRERAHGAMDWFQN